MLTDPSAFINLILHSRTLSSERYYNLHTFLHMIINRARSLILLSNPEYSLEELMLKLKLQCFDHLIQRADSLEKTQMLGKIKGRRRRGTTEDEMVEWHH